MKPITTHHGAWQPRLVGLRKPIRPVRVAAAIQPVSVTKPIVLGGELIASRRLPLRRTR